MQSSNNKIKKALINLGFHNLYLFPHLRFSKDYHIENADFDAFGWRKGEKHISFFQFKTNKKPSKKILMLYKKLEKKYYIKCYWINVVDRKGVFFYNYKSIKQNSNLIKHMNL